MPCIRNSRQSKSAGAELGFHSKLFLVRQAPAVIGVLSSDRAFSPENADQPVARNRFFALEVPLQLMNDPYFDWTTSYLYIEIRFFFVVGI